MYSCSIGCYCLSRRAALRPQDRNPPEKIAIILEILAPTLDHIPITR